MYICIMEKKTLNDLTPEEEVELNLKVNDDFKYFSHAYDDIVVADATDGQFMKLRVGPRDNVINGDEYFAMADIFFELKWKLHMYKRKHTEITKMIVSDLQLSQVLRDPDACFRRGLMIKIKFI